MTDLGRAFAALKGKQARYDLLWAYYDGDHPLRYSTERLRELFRDINARFVQNWCAVVIDAAKDRLNLDNLHLGDDQTDGDELSRLWAESGLRLDADDALLAALVTGESFVIVWPDETGRPQGYYNDPRLCHAFYDAENPRRMTFAAKWWVGDDERRYLTLYYPDRLDYYVSSGKAENVQEPTAFQPAEPPTAPNPYGQIPVFHFRRERRAVRSELANVISLQDAINKLLADMMVTAEFAAFPERYAVTNADLKNIKSAPNTIIEIPAGSDGEEETQVGQFPAADLGNYLEAIDRLASSMAIITRTPKHFFFAQGGDPSGEALIAMEAPLTKKCRDLIERFTPVWEDVGRFLLRVAQRPADGATVTAEWEDVETVQPRASAEIDQIRRQIAVLDHQLGASKQTLLTKLGYDAAKEAQQREAESEELGDELLGRFDRGE